MVLEYWFVTNDSIENQNGPANNAGIYDIYNKMSLMLKSLITLTRATPAYKLSCSGQSADSYVICYRVYQADILFENIMKTKPKEISHYTPETKLGTISSDVNTLTISFSYRTNMTACSNSNLEIEKTPNLLPVQPDHFLKEASLSPKQNDSKWDSNTPLVAAFATSPSKNIAAPFPLLPESAFVNLLVSAQPSTPEPENMKKSEEFTPDSQPISIPDLRKKANEIVSSTCSSADSFVFVEMKAPFASHDQHELGSFFNGPCPAFSGSGDMTEELENVTSQLADIESNLDQWDSFVDSVCSAQGDEDSVKASA
jgi:hypothetical protein